MLVRGSATLQLLGSSLPLSAVRDMLRMLRSKLVVNSCKASSRWGGKDGAGSKGLTSSSERKVASRIRTLDERDTMRLLSAMIISWLISRLLLPAGERGT